MSLKARALFFLNRYVTDAEERAEVNQEKLAQQGASYTKRIQLIERSEKFKNEAEALRWAYTKLSAIPDES